MTASIFWYDYETTGIDPRRDRPFQVAGLRTDEQLNIIDEPINLYSRLSEDVLPHPMACLITGITPEILLEKGLAEVEFVRQLHGQLTRPGTCTAGYNSLRFDDEVTRNSLYRNFYDPYAREWQGGNSRWDLIDVVRTAYALRPEGIVWPEHEGRVSLRLELLSAANGLDHEHAHDALSDVYATLAVAKLIRQQQPKLYDYLYALRSKARVLDLVRLWQPMVHISGRFSAERSYLSVILPLAWHPTNRNALIVCDLQSDCSPLQEESASVLRERLYTRREQLLPGQLPIPLKLVHVNRCPVLLPLKVLRQQDQQRLQVDLAGCLAQAAVLTEHREQWQGKLQDIYQTEDFAQQADPEQALYAGFLQDRDRRLCERVRAVDAAALAQEQWPFDDGRLPELLFRYRARNYPETLTAEERQRWWLFCQLRLSDAGAGAANTLSQFAEAYQALDSGAITTEQEKVLSAWWQHIAQLRQRYQIA